MSKPLSEKVQQKLRENETKVLDTNYDAVNPPHYKRGPVLNIDIGDQITKGLRWHKHSLQCIEVFRYIRDPRLATAFKYIWRVAFGGKADPNYTGSQKGIDRRDIQSAIWYLTDYLNNELQED